MSDPCSIGIREAEIGMIEKVIGVSSDLKSSLLRMNAQQPTSTVSTAMAGCPYLGCECLSTQPPAPNSAGHSHGLCNWITLWICAGATIKPLPYITLE